MSTSKVRKTKPKDEGSEPHSGSAYFLSIELRNVRCFGNEGQTLDLSDRHGKPAQWTILLGQNGTGKTTILQSLASFELNLAGNLGDDEVPTTSYWKPYPNSRRVLRGFLRNLESLPALLKAETAEGFTFKAVSEVRSKNLSILQINKILERNDLAVRELKEYLKYDKADLSFFPNMIAQFKLYSSGSSPTCYGYGALRRLGSTSLRNSETAEGTSGLFRDDVDLVDAEEWLLRLDYSASKPSEIQEQQQKRREQVKDLLLNILPEVEGIRFAVPIKARPDPTVEFQTPYGWVPLRQLSHGYQTLIAWMVDLASRMVDRYPDSPDPLAEPAVVLVDEIDLHLHPRWQRDLIAYLTERFPNTQFIATAHSPLIVQAASDANIAVLRREGDHVVIDNDVDAIKNWRIDQILTSDLFELPSARPPQLDGLMKRRQELLTRPKLSKAARAELAEIEAKIGDLPTGETPEQIDLMKRIDATLNRLEDRQGRKG